MIIAQPYSIFIMVIYMDDKLSGKTVCLAKLCKYSTTTSYHIKLYTDWLDMLQLVIIGLFIVNMAATIMHTSFVAITYGIHGDL